MIGDDSKALSQQRYSEFAQRYVTSKTHAEGDELNRLIGVAQPQPDWVVLDVATGGGHTALKFAPFVAQVTATDITPKILERAEAYIASKGIENVAFEPADAENLPYNDRAFDLVVCRIAPHHFPDCPRFVQEGARVLKTGGTLLVQDITLPEDEGAARYVDTFEKLRDPSHHRGYAESEWVGIFQEAGLVVEHIEQIVKRHEFVPWAERQDCTPDVIERLISMVERAPEAVTDWMQPCGFGTPQAVFINHHIIIAGRKR